MRFMLLAKATSEYESGMPPKPELMAAIGRFGQEMASSGVLVDQGGLMPSAAASRVRAARGRTTVIDGPFAETKELVAGYAIVDVATKAEAISVAERFLQMHMDILGAGYKGESEVRQMFEMPPQG